MTPKEKAIELKEKCDGYACYAEAAVDEVINVLSVLPYGMEYLNHIDYWEGVKIELEKL